MTKKEKKKVINKLLKRKIVKVVTPVVKKLDGKVKGLKVETGKALSKANKKINDVELSSKARDFDRDVKIDKLRVKVKEDKDNVIKFQERQTQLLRGDIANIPKVSKVEVLNQKDFPKDFRVNNLNEISREVDVKSIKEPIWYKKPINELRDSFKRNLDDLANKTIDVNVVSGRIGGGGGHGGGGIRVFADSGPNDQKALVNSRREVVIDANGSTVNIGSTVNVYLRGLSVNATIVGGTVAVGSTLFAVVNTLATGGMTVYQGNNPWMIGGSIANSGFGSSVSNFPLSFGVSITNWTGASITNWAGASGGNRTVVNNGGSVGVVQITSPWVVTGGISVSNMVTGVGVSITGGSISNGGFGASITNWSGIRGESLNITIAGGSITNKGFGATVTNWPAIYDVTGSTVGIGHTLFAVVNTSATGGMTVMQGTNPWMIGGSIANGGFGASITNWSGIRGESINVTIISTGFGASVTNWSGASGGNRTVMNNGGSVGVVQITSPWVIGGVSLMGGSINNSGFGASVTNWGGASGNIRNIVGNGGSIGVVQITSPWTVVNSGGSVGVVMISGVSIMGGSIANGGFGSSVTNWAGGSGLYVNDLLSNPLTRALYDFIGMSYGISQNLTSVIFKTGGAAGTSISGLGLSYDANNNLTYITKT